MPRISGCVMGTTRYHLPVWNKMWIRIWMSRVEEERGTRKRRLPRGGECASTIAASPRSSSSSQALGRTPFPYVLNFALGCVDRGQQLMHSRKWALSCCWFN